MSAYDESDSQKYAFLEESDNLDHVDVVDKCFESLRDLPLPISILKQILINKSEM